MDIGFAWSARTRELMHELQNLYSHRLDGDNLCLDGTVPEHLPVFDVPVSDYVQTTGMVLGASSAVESMTLRAWISISLMTMCQWPLTGVSNVAQKMRDGSFNNGNSA